MIGWKMYPKICISIYVENSRVTWDEELDWLIYNGFAPSFPGKQHFLGFRAEEQSYSIGWVKYCAYYNILRYRKEKLTTLYKRICSNVQNHYFKFYVHWMILIIKIIVKISIILILQISSYNLLSVYNLSFSLCY